MFTVSVFLTASTQNKSSCITTLMNESVTTDSWIDSYFELAPPCLIYQWFLKYDTHLAASALPGNLEMKIVRFHLRPMESEILGVVPINLCFYRFSTGFWGAIVSFGLINNRAPTILLRAPTWSISPSLVDHFHQHTYSCCYFSRCTVNMLLTSLLLV